MSFLAKRTFVLTSRTLSRLTRAKTMARHHISRRFSVPATSPSYVSTNKATVPVSEILERPQLFPDDGFEPILTNSLIEEEMLPGYQAGQYYPVRLGEVLGHRYQAFAKVGLGSSATIWLARDLRDRQYVTLKVCTLDSSKHRRELQVYRQISRRSKTTSDRGRNNILKILDSFVVHSPHGEHAIMVLEAAQVSLRDMRMLLPQGEYDEFFVKAAIVELLKALDFLHSHGEIVHTDIHSGNMLLGVFDNNIFQELESLELESPVARKTVTPNRAIYNRRFLPPKGGPLLLSDFSEARIGPGPHTGNAMPTLYRAPEILLCTGRSYPIDIWCVGLTAWDLFGQEALFTAREDNGELTNAAHLAQLIAALGPPHPDLLARNPETRAEYWDDQGCVQSTDSSIIGNWLEFAPIPQTRTLEALETRSKDKQGFLRFLRRTLSWFPEDRPTAKEPLQDPWLKK